MSQCLKNIAAMGVLIALTMAARVPSAAETISLNDIPSIHAFSVDRTQPDRLYLATHNGFFLATSDGRASQISGKSTDFTGFVRHPESSSVFFASGQKSGGGSLGVLRSGDGGKTWKKISDGAGGSPGFNAMAISPLDPNLMFGANEDLQFSADGGINWEISGPLPAEVFSLAASALDGKTIFAATRKGLYRSPDRGRSWQPAYMVLKPATMVNVSAAGKFHAYIYGVGLLAAGEADLDWNVVNSSFEDRFLWDLEADPADPGRLFALVDTGALMLSKDGGGAWTSFENYQWAEAGVVEKGRVLYEDNCLACHGERAVGERPKDMYAKDEFGFVAPPLDNSAHGWHHSDQGIVQTVLNGSDRNKRMIAWKESLSRGEVENIVAYIKSLWTFRSTACQGSRHMVCLK